MAAGNPTLLANNVTYMPFGPFSSLVYGNGLVRSQNYDLDYRLTGLKTSASGANVQNLSLGYDAVNDITCITDNLTSPNTQILRYDEDYRLTQAVGVYGYLGYTYDADGNRLTSTARNVTQTYNYSPAANMLQSTVASGAARNLAYTLNGNLSSDNRGGTSTLVFNYGNRNRYNALYSGATTVATYQHNALGERLVKTVGAATTCYHYDQRHHLIAETQSGGTLIREYVWLDDMPLAQIEGSGALYYIHPDHLSTPQKMTDATQTTVWSNEDQPFGETVPPSLTSVGYNAGKQFQDDDQRWPKWQLHRPSFNKPQHLHLGVTHQQRSPLHIHGYKRLNLRRPVLSCDCHVILLKHCQGDPESSVSWAVFRCGIRPQLQHDANLRPDIGALYPKRPNWTGTGVPMLMLTWQTVRWPEWTGWG